MDTHAEKRMEVGRIYEIYIDVLAVNNFFADFAAFTLVNYFMKKGVRGYRIAGSAVLGTFGSCLAFVLCRITAVYLMFVHFFINPLVLYFCFREKSRKDFLTDLAVSYCAFLFLGGVIEWLYAGGNGMLSYPAALIVSVVLFSAVLLWGRYCLKCRIRYLDIHIRGQGTQIRLQALADSGNLLMDPYTGKPVSMIDRSIYEAAYGPPQAVRLIPYESLGCRHGLLEAVTVEELSFAYGNRGIKVHQAVIGLADHALFNQKTYQMIINPQELSDEKTEHPTGGRYDGDM